MKKKLLLVEILILSNLFSFKLMSVNENVEMVLKYIKEEKKNPHPKPKRVKVSKENRNKYLAYRKERDNEPTFKAIREAYLKIKNKATTSFNKAKTAFEKSPELLKKKKGEQLLIKKANDEYQKKYDSVNEYYSKKRKQYSNEEEKELKSGVNISPFYLPGFVKGDNLDHWLDKEDARMEKNRNEKIKEAKKAYKEFYDKEIKRFYNEFYNMVVTPLEKSYQEVLTKWNNKNPKKAEFIEAYEKSELIHQYNVVNLYEQKGWAINKQIAEWARKFGKDVMFNVIQSN